MPSATAGHQCEYRCRKERERGRLGNRRKRHGEAGGAGWRSAPRSVELTAEPADQIDVASDDDADVVSGDAPDARGCQLVDPDEEADVDRTGEPWTAHVRATASAK